MSKCAQCSSEIPKSRYTKWHKNIKYCSLKCGKIFIYLKHTKNKRSFYRNDAGWEETESGTGYKWERFVANLLNGEWQGFRAPFDVLWRNKKIDVKSAELYKRKNKHGKTVVVNHCGWFSFHKYSRNNNQKDIDYLFCIGTIGGAPYKMWLIPYGEVKKDFTITPNASERYDGYLIKYGV